MRGTFFPEVLQQTWFLTAFKCDIHQTVLDFFLSSVWNQRHFTRTAHLLQFFLTPEKKYKGHACDRYIVLKDLLVKAVFIKKSWRLSKQSSFCFPYSFANVILNGRVFSVTQTHLCIFCPFCSDPSEICRWKIFFWVYVWQYIFFLVVIIFLLRVIFNYVSFLIKYVLIVFHFRFDLNPFNEKELEKFCFSVCLRFKLCISRFKTLR